MSGLCGKIDSLLRLLSFWSVFFNHKAELKLRYLFDDKNSLQVFAYLAKIYTYNIQIIPPPYILRATLSESNCLFVEITIQLLGKNNKEIFPLYGYLLAVKMD
jgi:hypothetical protein